jgi:hypothetical protein
MPDIDIMRFISRNPEIPMTIARFARYLPIAGVLVMSGAAHAETAQDIIDRWAADLVAAVDMMPDRRESYMKSRTAEIQKVLETVACAVEKDATDTANLVKKAKDRKQIPIKYTYAASCDLKTKKMKVKFTLDSVDKDLLIDKLYDANLDIVKRAVAAWGTAAKKAVDQTRDRKKAKADVDAATAAAKATFSGIYCRPMAQIDIKSLLDQEVKNRGLDFVMEFSRDCDAPKRALTIKFEVTAIKLPSEAATDKPVNVMVENVEPSAADLTKMGLVAKDVVLSVEALDLATGAGAKPATISLSAKEKKPLSLKPAAEGNIKVKLDVSFRGKKCASLEVDGPARKTIQVTLKTVASCAVSN